MITTSGKNFIKRYLAGQAGDVVGAIAVGVGDTAAALGDERLEFEFARTEVDVISYDFVNDKLIFKGTLPQIAAGEIREVALYTSEVDSGAGAQASRLISTFDSGTEDWSNATYTTSGVRLGADALLHSPSASGTSTSALTSLTMGFSDHSSSDEFVLAYNVGNANTANIKLRFKKDASNYYEYTITSPGTGYAITKFTKGSATVTGTPSWDAINEVEVSTTATGGGAASVFFDGLRIEDVDAVSVRYGLIARFIPVTPVVKQEGSYQDVEYALDVTV